MDYELGWSRVVALWKVEWDGSVEVWMEEWNKLERKGKREFECG